jgi:fibro-slime domain-containing protein
MRRSAWAAVVCAAVGLAVACGSSGDDSGFGQPVSDDEGGASSGTSGTFVTQDASQDTNVPDSPILDCDADPAACLPPGVCGDGKPGLGESCDDGNTTNGDGCSSMCQIEAPYWACTFGKPCIDVRDCAALVDAGLTDGGDGGCVAPPKAAVCGDGTLDPGEACDDGNVTGGDGCSFDCKTIEANYVCPTPGAKCISTVVCGDSKITGAEQCDDGNTTSGDGCSSTCTLESGWVCLLPGASCTAAKCGDGLLAAGPEECDDGNNVDGDGCSATCRLQTTTTTTNPTSSTQGHTTLHNWDCAYPVPINVPPHEVCAQTVCGNGIREGTEQCDDNNTAPFDGCSPDCQFEPQCPGGTCVARCGDGLLFDFDADGDGKPDEGCDDGNTRNGDGCSSTCQVESGYQCTTVADDFPAFLDLPVVLRDFKFWNSGDPQSHPDFERYGCPQVTPDLNMTALTGGVPIFRWDGTGNDPVTGTDTNGTCGQQLTSATDYTDWYRDIDINVGGTNYRRSQKITDVQLRLTRSGTPGNYSYAFNSDTDLPYSTYFPGGPGNCCFFPIDGRGWGNQGSTHNFSFSTELRYWFTYDAATSPQLDFSGDDDVWVFVNGKLALDLGGLHPRVAGSFTLDAAKAAALGLADKHLYEIALFHAERHTTASNFWLTLRGFAKKHSVCNNVCGDGIKTREEQCDLGPMNTMPPVPYGGCSNTCTLGPYCGDKTITTPPEQCDDGTNLTPWTSATPTTQCGPGCKTPVYCGDGNVDFPFEQCDQGASNTNSGAYGSCTTSCTLGPRCGDGIVQTSAGEQCDDGNRVNGDGCSAACQMEGPPH